MANIYNSFLIKEIKQELKNRKKRLSFYSIFWHRIYWGMMMLIILLGSMFLLPPFLKTMEQLISQIWNLDSDKALLPDFFGGLCGILVGFLIDAIVFQKIQDLRKYNAIVKSINTEFKDLVEKTLDKHFETTIAGSGDINKVRDDILKVLVDESFKSQNDICKKEPSTALDSYINILNGDCVDDILEHKIESLSMVGLDMGVLDVVVSDPENISLFYNLPTYLMIEEKGNILRALLILQDICQDLTECTKDEDDKTVQNNFIDNIGDIFDLLIRISDFTSTSIGCEDDIHYGFRIVCNILLHDKQIKNDKELKKELKKYCIKMIKTSPKVVYFILPRKLCDELMLPRKMKTLLNEKENVIDII